MSDRYDFIYRNGLFVPSVSVEAPATISSSFFPPERRTRVMAVGDSLTQGQGNEAMGGYRLRLWQKLFDAGFNFVPVGYQTTPPYSNNGHQYYNSRWSGFGGWKIGDIARSGGINKTGKGIAEWIADWAPDVLLLMIGTNDLSETANQTTLSARFNDLLDVIYTAKPNISIIWGRLPQYQTTVWAANTTYSNNAVAALQARVAQDPANRKLAVADHGVLTGTAKFADYVHLNATGYTEMADIWYQTIISN